MKLLALLAAAQIAWAGSIEITCKNVSTFPFDFYYTTREGANGPVGTVLARMSIDDDGVLRIDGVMPYVTWKGKTAYPEEGGLINEPIAGQPKAREIGFFLRSTSFNSIGGSEVASASPRWNVTTRQGDGRVTFTFTPLSGGAANVSAHREPTKLGERFHMDGDSRVFA